MICAICHDNISNENRNIYTTECNHSFHLECIKSWINTLDKKNQQFSCPMCRNYLIIETIKFKNDYKNVIYNTKKICRKSINIDNQLVTFLHKQLQDQTPKAWVDFRNDLYPLYKLYIENGINKKFIYITSYFRTYLLYSNKKKDIKKIEKKDFNGENYYDLDEDSIVGTFSKNAFIIVFEWCIQVLQLIKKEYNISFHQYYNTILIDLSFYTMINLNLENKKSMFQAIFTCSMFNIIHKFSNKPITLLPKIEYFIYLTDNTYELKELTHIMNMQKKYLNTNINILL